MFRVTKKKAYKKEVKFISQTTGPLQYHDKQVLPHKSTKIIKVPLA